MDREKLKRLLGIEDETRDFMVDFLIEDVEEIIKNYCNVEKVPEGLLNTAYRMAMDLYRNENIGQDSAAVSVSSITEGDTSTSFKQYADDNFKDTILKNYSRTLNRYRKVVF